MGTDGEQQALKLNIKSGLPCVGIWMSRDDYNPATYIVRKCEGGWVDYVSADVLHANGAIEKARITVRLPVTDFLSTHVLYDIVAI